MPPASPPRSAADRLLDVLAAFDLHHPALSLTEISRRAGLPLATTHRLVGELTGVGRAGARRGRPLPDRPAAVGGRRARPARPGPAGDRHAVPGGPLRGHPRERPARRARRAEVIYVERIAGRVGRRRAQPGRRPVAGARDRRRPRAARPRRRRSCRNSYLPAPADRVHRRTPSTDPARLRRDARGGTAGRLRDQRPSGRPSTRCRSPHPYAGRAATWSRRCPSSCRPRHRRRRALVPAVRSRRAASPARWAGSPAAPHPPPRRNGAFRHMEDGCRGATPVPMLVLCQPSRTDGSAMTPSPATSGTSPPTADEVGGDLLARTILGEPIVFYRTEEPARPSRSPTAACTAGSRCR